MLQEKIPAMKTYLHSFRGIWLFCLCVFVLHAQAQQAGTTKPPTSAQSNGIPNANAQTPATVATNGTAMDAQLHSNLNAIAGTNTLTVTVASDPNEMVLKYEEFLEEETKTHREFIENMNKQVGVSIAIVLAVAGFFGFRSWKDLKSQAYVAAEKMAESGIQSGIGNALEKRNRWLEKTQKASREKVFREFRSLFSKQILNHHLTLPKVADEKILKGKKVLWVDDDPVGIACQVAILEALKMPVTVVQTTNEAIEMLAEDGFAVVISNMNRDPEPLAGILLVQAIRKDSKIPIMIFTKQQHVDNYGDKAKEAGVSVLESNPDRIVPQIEQLIGNRKSTTIIT